MNCFEISFTSNCPIELYQPQDKSKDWPDCNNQNYSQRCGDLLFDILISVIIAVELVFILSFLKKEKQHIILAKLC